MTKANQPRPEAPQNRSPHEQAYVRGVEISILRPGNACLHIAIALAVFMIPSIALAQQSKPWEQIPIPPLHAFHPQQPKRIELKNGIVIFLQEDHELPFISGSVLIPGGSRDEDPAKAGLVTLYSQAWRTSGTAKDERRRHGRSARIQGRAY